MIVFYYPCGTPTPHNSMGFPHLGFKCNRKKQIRGYMNHVYKNVLVFHMPREIWTNRRNKRLINTVSFGRYLFKKFAYKQFAKVIRSVILRCEVWLEEVYNINLLKKLIYDSTCTYTRNPNIYMYIHAAF